VALVPRELKVLGTGCPRCVSLAENAEKAARELGVDYVLEKVTDLDAIMSWGVMMTPALVIDGKVVSSGSLLSPGQIRELLERG
jgi:small redox-active disulfide protein 2